jgi:hypothetical protein
MENRCPSCSTVIPVGAKYCPKCGTLAPPGPTSLPVSPNALPSTAPLPRAGLFFIALGLLGLALLVVGFLTRRPPLIYAGSAIVGVLILAVLAGDLLS